MKEHHRIIYYNYLTAGTLCRHLAEIDERASEMFNRLVKELSAKENITEKLKSDNLMEWIRQINNIRSRATEAVVINKPWRLSQSYSCSADAVYSAIDRLNIPTIYL